MLDYRLNPKFSFENYLQEAKKALDAGIISSIPLEPEIVDLTDKKYEYVVTCCANFQSDSLYNDLTNETQKHFIPFRKVKCTNNLFGNPYSTMYELSYTEAVNLRNDPRIKEVTLKYNPYSPLVPQIVQTSDFRKVRLRTDVGFFWPEDSARSGYNTNLTLGENRNIKNFALKRCNSPINEYGSSLFPNGQTDGISTYNNNWDGTGVDIIIIDEGLQTHPEWEDSAGNTRLVTDINWPQAAGSDEQNINPNTFFNKPYGAHGNHCAGIAAGKTFGWAKNAKIYDMRSLGGGTEFTDVISLITAFGIIRAWHLKKPIDPITGLRRPTIISMSLGVQGGIGNIRSSTNMNVGRDDPQNGQIMARYISGSWAINHEMPQQQTARPVKISVNNAGTTFDYYDWNVEQQPLVSGGGQYTSLRYFTNDSVLETYNIALNDLLETPGLYAVVAAGNSGREMLFKGNPRYSNKLGVNQEVSGFNYYIDYSLYDPGCPFSQKGIIVGSTSNYPDSSGKETRALYSNFGETVDIYAPGTNIVSAGCNSVLGEVSQETLDTSQDYKNGRPNSYWDSTNVQRTGYRQVCYTGTSMACPQVTGVLALALQKYIAETGELPSYSKVKQFFRNTSETVSTSDFTNPVIGNLNYNLTTIDYDGKGTFFTVAKNTNKAFFSTDGITWSERTLPETRDWAYAVTNIENFLIVTKNSNRILSSNNNLNWIDRPFQSYNVFSGAFVDLDEATYSKDWFLSKDAYLLVEKNMSGSFPVSLDMSTRLNSLNTEVAGPLVDINVSESRQSFIENALSGMVGLSGGSYTAADTDWVSSLIVTDYQAWNNQKRLLLSTTKLFSQVWLDIDNLSSGVGVWSIISLPSTSSGWLKLIEGGDSKLVILEKLGTHGVVTSVDGGATWTSAGLNFGVELFDIIYAAGRYFVTGKNVGTMATTKDFITFKNVILPTSGSYKLIAGVDKLILQDNAKIYVYEIGSFESTKNIPCVVKDQIYDPGNLGGHGIDQYFGSSNNNFLYWKYGNDTVTAPTYTLTGSATNVDEGQTITITLTTNNVAAGSLVPYTITGITSADINGESLTGNFTVSLAGITSKTLTITADNITENNETAVIKLDDRPISFSFSINDTSKTPSTVPTYKLTSDKTSVDEGSVVRITLTTTNVENGTVIPFIVAGLTTSEYSSSNSNFVINSNTSFIDITITDNSITFDRLLTLGVDNNKTVITINVVNKNSPIVLVPTYILTSNASTVNEGDVLTITLTTTNVSDGTSVPYTIIGANASDLAGINTTTGNFTITAGTSSLLFTIASDKTTEGKESFVLSLNNGKASISVDINDTSLGTESYNLICPITTVNEGKSVPITLATSGISLPASIPYTITGITSADINGESLTGTFVLNKPVVTKWFKITPDLTTETSETFTLTLDTIGTSVSFAILDTSKTPETTGITFPGLNEKFQTVNPWSYVGDLASREATVDNATSDTTVSPAITTDFFNTTGSQVILVLGASDIDESRNQHPPYSTGIYDMPITLIRASTNATLVNRAYGGWTSNEILGDLPNAVSMAGGYENIKGVIMGAVGGNDMFARNSNTDITLASIKNNVSTIVNNFTSRNIPIVMCAFPECTISDWTYDSTVDSLVPFRFPANRKLSDASLYNEIYQANPEKIIFVDNVISFIFNDASYLLNAIHPNQNGMYVYAQRIMDVVSNKESRSRYVMKTVRTVLSENLKSKFFNDTYLPL